MADPIIPKMPPMPPLRAPMPPSAARPALPSQRLPIPPRPAAVPPGALPPKREAPPSGAAFPAALRESAEASGKAALEAAQLKERLLELESKTKEAALKSQSLEEQKATLEEKISRMDKLLLEEREKVALTNLRSQEEKSVGLRVEASLREIQEKLRRDQRERELELNRSKLENQVKEMEKKLAHERETWVEALKGQMSKRDLEDRAVEERMNAKVRDLEQRFSQERSRFGAKMEEKNREIEELKKALVIKEESWREESLRHQEVARILKEREERLASLGRELENAPRLKEESSLHERERQELMQDVTTLSNELRQAKKTIEDSQHALKQREAWMLRARAALAAGSKRRQEFQSQSQEFRLLKTRYSALTEMARRLQRERQEVQNRFEQKTAQVQAEIERMRQSQWGVEQERLKVQADAQRLALEKDLQERQIRELEAQNIRLRHEMELSGKANLELPGVLRQLETARKEMDQKATALVVVQEELRRSKTMTDEYSAQRQELSQELESLRRELMLRQEDARKLEEETLKNQELFEQIEEIKKRWEGASLDLVQKNQEISNAAKEIAALRQSAHAESVSWQERLMRETRNFSQERQKFEELSKELEKFRQQNQQAQQTHQAQENHLKKQDQELRLSLERLIEMETQNKKLQDRCDHLENQLHEARSSKAAEETVIEQIKAEEQTQRGLSQRLLSEMALLKERASALEAAQQAQAAEGNLSTSSKLPVLEQELAQLKDAQAALETTLLQERSQFQDKLDQAHKILEYQCLAYEEKLREAFDRLGKKAQEESAPQATLKESHPAAVQGKDNPVKRLASWLSKPVS